MNLLQLKYSFITFKSTSYNELIKRYTQSINSEGNAYMASDFIMCILIFATH